MKRISYSTIGIIFLFIVGIGIMLYPTVSDYINRMNSSRAIVQYQEKLSKISKEEYNEILREAREYNEKLTGFFVSGEPLSETYQKLLNASDDGMMGYVEIPTLNQNIPIYHGTGADVLQDAVGHLEGSSLPVGGPGSHAVITGHSGLPSAKIFTDLKLLEKGDLFSIMVLGEELIYQVEEMMVVSPKETEEIKIVPNEDYATLITCTPYAVNTHRLLVRGVRVQKENDSPEHVQDNSHYVECFILANILTIIIMVVELITMGRKRRSKR